MNVNSNGESVRGDAILLPAKSLVSLKINNIDRQIEVAPQVTLLDLPDDRKCVRDLPITIDKLL